MQVPWMWLSHVIFGWVGWGWHEYKTRFPSREEIWVWMSGTCPYQYCESTLHFFWGGGGCPGLIWFLPVLKPNLHPLVSIMQAFDGGWCSAWLGETTDISGVIGTERLWWTCGWISMVPVFINKAWDGRLSADNKPVNMVPGSRLQTI